MMWIKHVAAPALALATLLSTFRSASAAGSPTSLRAGVLGVRDVPGGFVTRQVKLFPHYSPDMKLAGQICTPSKASRGAWKQGLHQVFLTAYPPSKDVDDLEICAFLYTRAATAVSDYEAFLAGARVSFQRRTTVRLAVPSIGNSVVAALAPLHNHLGAYLLAFRFGSALIGMSYVYSRRPLMTPRRFVQLAQLEYARLARGG